MKYRTMNKPGDKLAMPRWDDRGGRIKNKNKLCAISGYRVPEEEKANPEEVKKLLERTTQSMRGVK
jgi:hypothetical protein